MGSSKLNRQAQRIMLDATKVFVSAASIWEIAIKARLGKLDGGPGEFVAAIDQGGFRELVIAARVMRRWCIHCHSIIATRLIAC